MKRKILGWLCVLLLLIGFVVPPQRANAVAVEAASVAAAAAVLASCGITVWADTDADINTYLGQQLDTYVRTLGENISVEDWLRPPGVNYIFDVVGDGAIKFSSVVGNKLLDFARWFTASQGVESGGAAVGVLGGTAPIWANYSGWLSGADIRTTISGNRIIVDFNNASLNISDGGTALNLIRIDAGITSGACEVTLVESSGFQNFSRNRWGAPTVQSTATSWVGTRYFLYDTGDTIRDSFSDTFSSIGLNFTCDSAQGAFSGCRLVFEVNASLSQPDSVVLTPGQVVTVRDALAENDSLVVNTTAPITVGLSEAEASTAIIDKVISADGLAGDDAVSEGVGAGWGWLADLIERVIGNTQHATYNPVDEYALDLTSFFPFCIPWDIYRALSLFDAAPITPSVEWEVPLPDGSTYLLQLDLHQFDGIAEVARALELLLFGVYLAVGTRKLIKW